MMRYIRPSKTHLAVLLNLVLCMASSLTCYAQSPQASTKAATERSARHQPIKTWAILGDKATIASGLTDAVLAELSSSDMQFVEREQLAQVFDEQALQSLLDGLSTESRRLGKALNADALIIIAHSTKPKAFEAGPKSVDKAIRLILCDCHKGLRLGELKSDIMPIDQQSSLLAKYILDRRQQFSEGIHSIIGLSPVACRNIEHDFDHLQQRFYDMLSGRLMTVPGLALLEFEEARTVASESGAGDQVGERLVPVMVECEYRVTTRQGMPIVNFKAELTGGKVRTLESPDLSMEKLGLWLEQELIDKILESTVDRPLELNDQQRMLADRADYLMQLGDMSNSVQCREAFLLAEPSNAMQRTQAIDQLLTLDGRFSETQRSFGLSHREQLEVVIGKFSIKLPILLDHLTFLIENRLIDQATAIALLDRINKEARPFQESLPFILQLWINEPSFRPGVDSISSALHRFVQYTAAKVLELPDSRELSPENKTRQMATWQNLVLGMLADEIGIHGGSMTSFEFLERFVMDSVPESLPTSWEALKVIENYQRSRPHSKVRLKDGTFKQVDIRIDDEAMKVWMRKLADSSHCHLRWYSRAVSILNELRQTRGKLSDAAREDLDLVIEEIERRPQSRVYSQSGALLDGVLSRLETERNQLMPRSEPRMAVTSNMPRPLPENDIVAGQLTVQSLNLQLPENETGILNYFRANSDVDVVECMRHVGLVQSDLKFTPIHTKKGIQSSTVCDGQHVWIAEPEHGIAQYDLQGRLKRRINEKDGLPKHDFFIQLLAFGPECLIVYGSIKPDGRCWIARVSIEENIPKIKIIHEARQPYRPLVNPKDARVPLPNNDPSMVFHLEWWCGVNSSEFQALYIGRLVSPLAINLKNGEVTPVSLEPYQANSYGTMLRSGNSLFKSFGTGVAQYDHPKGTLQPKLKKIVVDGLPTGTVPIWVDKPSTLAEHDGWIYKPGRVWYRFRADGESLQRLTLTESPAYWQYPYIASSNHFGIVGWAKETSAPEIYKITPPQ